MHASQLFGICFREEVSCMNVMRFIEAVGASVVGYYVCKAIDYAVTLFLG